MITPAQILQSRVFRYFISAGTATCVDVGTYFLCFNYLFDKHDMLLGSGLVLSAPTASLIISYSLGLVTNFVITKHLVFKESELATHKQLFRFVLVALMILCLNWLFMRFLIRQLDWFPTIARAVSALTIGVLSFLIHRSFSFQVKKQQ